MKQAKLRSIGRWVMALGAAAVLAACGGGGGSSDEGTTAPEAAQPVPAPPAPQPVADARNGTYTLLAANTFEYALTLDFDAKTYRVTGNGVDQAGGIAAAGSEFLFTPGNSAGATGTTTARFTYVDNTAIGALPLPEGAVPFIAPREFETTVAGAAGRYNALGRTVDTATGERDTTIQQAELLADGVMRTCVNLAIVEISACPANSIVSGTLTVSGSLFREETPFGDALFRIAKVGGDKVMVRASPSTGTLRRFMIGVPAGTSFAAATFIGASTEPRWDGIALSASAFSETGVTPAGATTTRSGAATPIAQPPSTLGNVLLANTADGAFFAARSSEIAVVVAGRGSAAAPGYLFVGKRQ